MHILESNDSQLHRHMSTIKFDVDRYLKPDIGRDSALNAAICGAIIFYLSQSINYPVKSHQKFSIARHLRHHIETDINHFDDNFKISDDF